MLANKLIILINALFGRNSETVRPPYRLLARLPTIPFPLSLSLWMHISASPFAYTLTTRNVPFSSLFVRAAYLASKTLHTLWCMARIEQERALFDALLGRRGICEDCRDRAFECRWCMVILLAGRLRRVGAVARGGEEVE
ncbi:hypothetical protein SVAN01_11316 [Stagonosporopsis vannaccii]|nr:hypothetical protein SVAN01_11316 [Stagonosporopsis vannaccii]